MGHRRDQPPELSPGRRIGRVHGGARRDCAGGRSRRAARGGQGITAAISITGDSRPPLLRLPSKGIHLPPAPASIHSAGYQTRTVGPGRLTLAPDSPPAPSRRSDFFLPEHWERPHGDRPQGRENMIEYSVSCINIRANDLLMSAEPDVGSRVRPGMAAFRSARSGRHRWLQHGHVARCRTADRCACRQWAGLRWAVSSGRSGVVRRRGPGSGVLVPIAGK